MVTLECREVGERRRWSLRRGGRSRDAGYEVALYFDLEGLEEFLVCLQSLRDEERDHFHCMTRAWGSLDLELSEERQTEWGGIVHHLRVDRMDMEWVPIQNRPPRR
jgi:hypothetical protein